MSITARALWVMERNSDQTLNLNGIAQSVGVSRSQLARAFGDFAGMPAMTYLRGRRLGRAAQALAEGAPDILSVALDAGYNSHEAFTRAFRDQFGMTPESLRRRGNLDGLPLLESLELRPDDKLPALRPKFVDGSEVRAVGLSAPYNFASAIGIPAQWQRFMSICDAIAYQTEEIPIGIGQVPDDEGQFRYVCAIAVERFGDIPAGLEAITIPAARYAVFEHNSHISSLYETYARIWNDALPAAGLVSADAPVIERHNPTFNTMTGEGGVTLWIPVTTATLIEPDDAKARNRETVEAYGRYADTYAERTSEMSADTRDLLDRFANSLPPAASILEIGSGPGWDADYLEQKGMVVRRTDASPQFVALQQKRGKAAELLDLVGDDLGGPYQGVVLLYVLQHIDDALLGPALGKIARCLSKDGRLLLTFRQGDEKLTEHGSSGNYHSTLRPPAASRDAMLLAGLQPEWERWLEDDDGVWHVVLARVGR